VLGKQAKTGRKIEDWDRDRTREQGMGRAGFRV